MADDRKQIVLAEHVTKTEESGMTQGRIKNLETQIDKLERKVNKLKDNNNKLEKELFDAIEHLKTIGSWYG